MKSTVLFTAGLLMAASAATAEDLSWFVLPAEGPGATLAYGTPDSGYAPISFRCDGNGDTLAVTVEHEPVNAADGVGVEVLFSAGDIEVPVATTGTRLEMDDLFILEGETSLDPRFQDLITSAGPLVMTIEDGAEEYPLDGAREAALEFFAACKAG
ncbi:hypothetical protein ASD64_07860 [Mesorhizobium sp. Root157]|uniref:hypothetical protein n=1 Tax=Mesorhizobium sp. Root157 TaxID=1736477 RepID=UPI0006F82A37|nr:hypothetical protein [Mesorhizobium sp. Root157]KQZ82847.1 hypothetical protein ASD64_07860 [Mesorhizobium sp. Root157]